MSLNSIRKILFTNRLAESVFILFLKFNFLKEVVNKLIPGNVLYKPKTFRTVKRKGIYYILDISDYQCWLIYFLSDHDSSMVLLNYLDQSQVIFDIGGNIGQTSLAINHNRLQRVKEHQVICFEPYPENAASIQANFRLNKQIENITLEQVGLGAEKGTLKMFKECEANSGGNRIIYKQDQDQKGIVEVPITTIDDYVNQKVINQVDFIKIDVEGFEYAVLSGGKNVLKTHKPKLFIELDSINLQNQGSSSSTLINFLEELNYSILDVEGNYTLDELKVKEVHTDVFCY